MCSDSLETRHDAHAESSLIGNWVPIAAYIAGEVVPVRELRIARLVLDGTSYAIHDHEQRVVDSGDLRVDATVTPRALDLVGGAGPAAGKTMLVIFELDSNLLTICYDMETNRRPATMEPLEDQLLLQITYTRSAFN